MVEDKELKRGLSLPMAIFIIVGMVIGASIWISPADYLSKTGPGIFLSYIIAVIPAVFIAYICAYLGSAFPVAGGTYVISSRLIGGFGGFMTVWLIILAVGSTLAYLAASFGIFIGQAIGIPSASTEMLWFAIIIGFVVLTFFYFLNWIKIEISGAIELVITIVGDILVMVIFFIGAIPAFKPSNFEPLLPLGFGPVLFAALVFYFSYTGFTLILDVAGEVKNPKKNIPKALLISIILLTGLYTIQAIMIAGVQPWGTYVGTVTDIILNSGLLPSGVVLFMMILISVAIGSTLHPSYMAFSRDIMMISREKLFPEKLSKLHKKNRTPTVALTVLYIAGLIFLFTFIPILTLTKAVDTVYTAAVLLSAVVGVVVLILQIPISIATFVLPKKFPKWHEQAGFKPSLRTLKIMGIIGSVSSLIFVLLLLLDPDAGLIISLIIFPFAGIGALIYLIRRNTLKKKGINIKEIMSKLPESVSFEEGIPSKVERLAQEKD